MANLWDTTNRMHQLNHTSPNGLLPLKRIIRVVDRKSGNFHSLPGITCLASVR